MNNKLLFGFVVLLVASGAAYFLLRPTPTAPSPTVPQEVPSVQEPPEVSETKEAEVPLVQEDVVSSLSQPEPEPQPAPSSQPEPAPVPEPQPEPEPEPEPAPPPPSPPPPPMAISSAAFAHNQTIPVKYTCDGQDLSPPLAFANVPGGAVSLALILDDPDAPGGSYVHWIAWNIPPGATGFAENSVAAGTQQGVSGSGTPGYEGSCPPRGESAHRYVFRLYALDISLSLPASTSKAGLEAAMAGHVLVQTELIGLYASP